jgi:hypothetical protein
VNYVLLHARAAGKSDSCGRNGSRARESMPAERRRKHEVHATGCSATGEDKEFLEKRRPGGRFPNFDLSVLIETSTPRAVDAVKESALYERMERAIRNAANDTVTITATNPKRIGPVDHSRNGSFLFNYPDPAVSG